MRKALKHDYKIDNNKLRHSTSHDLVKQWVTTLWSHLSSGQATCLSHSRRRMSEFGSYLRCSLRHTGHFWLFSPYVIDHAKMHVSQNRCLLQHCRGSFSIKKLKHVVRHPSKIAMPLLTSSCKQRQTDQMLQRYSASSSSVRLANISTGNPPTLTLFGFKIWSMTFWKESSRTSTTKRAPAGGCNVILLSNCELLHVGLWNLRRGEL